VWGSGFRPAIHTKVQTAPVMHVSRLSRVSGLGVGFGV
jgi:hypothetical protein